MSYVNSERERRVRRKLKNGGQKGFAPYLVSENLI